MQRRRFIFTLLLGVCIGLGPALSTGAGGSARAGNIERGQRMTTFSGAASDALAGLSQIAAAAAEQLARMSEDEMVRQQAKAAQAAIHANDVAVDSPWWPAGEVTAPWWATDSGAEWVGPLYTDSRSLTDVAFVYAAHAWLGVSFDDRSYDAAAGNAACRATAANVRRAWTRNFAGLASDVRHSTGNDDALALNAEQDGVDPLRVRAKNRTTAESQVTVATEFQGYTFGYETSAYEAWAALHASCPARRPAAIAPSDEAATVEATVSDWCEGRTDEQVDVVSGLGSFELLVNGPSRYVFLRVAPQQDRDLQSGQIASIACRDATDLGAVEREREAEERARAILASASAAMERWGTALIGWSKHLSEAAERRMLPDERRANADAAQEQEAWTGDEEAFAPWHSWDGRDPRDLEFQPASWPYLGL